MENDKYSAELIVLASVQNYHCSTVEYTDLFWNFHGKKVQTYLWICMECCSYISK